MKTNLDFKNFDYEHLLIQVDGPPQAVDVVIAAVRASLKKLDGSWDEI